MYTDDDLLPISALQHLAFCARQWGLIHLEGQWAENRLTAEGRRLHDKAHEAEVEQRGDVRSVTGLWLRSSRLGLIGRADVVEYTRLPDGEQPGNTAVQLPGAAGWWRPMPVEYKRGRPKPDHCDLVQVCAQALCLEEMLDVTIPQGAIFYGQPRRRLDMPFVEALRRETEDLAARLHTLTEAGVTPRAAYAPKCDSCSLMHVCLPKVTGAGRSAQRYIEAMVNGD